MRLAIGRISDGEVEYAKKICAFVRDIYRELTLVVPLMDDNSEMKKKMEVMLQSVVKIENGIVSFMPNTILIFPSCMMTTYKDDYMKQVFQYFILYPYYYQAHIIIA